MPKVVTATYAGVCFGVKRAVDILDKALDTGRTEGRPVLMFGPLIHNPRFIESYRRKGVEIVDRSGIRDHAVVVIRSHGITRDEEEYLTTFSDLRIIDTTCPFVQRIHRLVAERSRDGWAIVVLGDAAHAEVEGFVSRIDGPYFVHPPDFSDASLAALDRFLRGHEKFFAVAQTTSQPDHFRQLIERMGGACRDSHCRFEYQNTVCDATFQRQETARELAHAMDAMVVIGGRNSSNTAKLFAIVSAENPRSFWVEAPGDLTAADRETLRGVEAIGLTAGASTPDDQIAELAAYLEAL